MKSRAAMARGLVAIGDESSETDSSDRPFFFIVRIFLFDTFEHGLACHAALRWVVV